jgi:hypothetical protein
MIVALSVVFLRKKMTPGSLIGNRIAFAVRNRHEINNFPYQSSQVRLVCDIV